MKSVVLPGPDVNQINPQKLANSKWTAVSPLNREKHFLVVKVTFDEDAMVTSCRLEAVLSRRSFEIDWRDLKKAEKWKQGWI